MSVQKQKSACVLVHDQFGHVIVVDHKKYGLSLPGGKVEKGEMFRKAAQRETAEESGFVIFQLNLKQHFDHVDELYWCRCFSYEISGHYSSHPPLSSTEATNPRWIKIDELLLPETVAHYKEAYIEIVDGLDS